MTSRTKGTVYRLTLTFPLCINPLNLIYHTFLLNDIKIMIFLLLSRLRWGAFSPPFRKITNGSQSRLYTFACTVTMWAPCEGLPFRGQWGPAPSILQTPMSRKHRTPQGREHYSGCNTTAAMSPWDGNTHNWDILNFARAAQRQSSRPRTETAALGVCHLTQLLAWSFFCRKHTC